MGQNLNVRIKNIKFLQENIDANLCDLNWTNFLDIPRVQPKKKKIDKLDHQNFLILCI